MQISEAKVYAKVLPINDLFFNVETWQQLLRQATSALFLRQDEQLHEEAYTWMYFVLRQAFRSIHCCRWTMVLGASVFRR